jgi:hypothetical protein
VKKELATTLALEVRPLNELLALRGLQPIPTAAEAGENLPLQAIARCLAGDCGRPASAAVETR